MVLRSRASYAAHPAGSGSRRQDTHANSSCHPADAPTHGVAKPCGPRQRTPRRWFHCAPECPHPGKQRFDCWQSRSRCPSRSHWTELALSPLPNPLRAFPKRPAPIRDRTSHKEKVQSHSPSGNAGKSRSHGRTPVPAQRCSGPAWPRSAISPRRIEGRKTGPLDSRRCKLDKSLHFRPCA